jgi:hypothetical protein
MVDDVLGVAVILVIELAADDVDAVTAAAL